MMAQQEWPDAAVAPGNDIVRVRGMRLLRTEDGRTTDVVDIREPIAFEIKFEVLKPGHVLVPNLLEKDDGFCVFVSLDRDPEWRRCPRPVGCFTSTVHIPGNFLADGRFVYRAGIITETPFKLHFDVNPAVAFQVVDSFDGDAARGDLAGQWPGVVRPLLKWSSRFTPAEIQFRCSLMVGFGICSYLRFRSFNERPTLFKAIFQSDHPGGGPRLWRRLQEIYVIGVTKRLDKFLSVDLPLVGFDLVSNQGGFNLSIALMDGNGGKVLDRY